MTMMNEPMKIVRLRPRMFPSQMVAIAPKKQPSVYAPTTQVSDRWVSCGTRLTSDGLDCSSMALRTSGWWVLTVNFRKISQEGAQGEQASHNTLVYTVISI